MSYCVQLRWRLIVRSLNQCKNIIIANGFKSKTFISSYILGIKYTVKYNHIRSFIIHFCISIVSAQNFC